MIFYVIMHKATGFLMPQAKKNRGYSHWNPAILNNKMESALGIPRLLDTRRKAANVVSQWASQPNLEVRRSMSYEGSEDYSLDSKPDGRTKDDLAVIEVNITGLPEEARF